MLFYDIFIYISVFIGYFYIDWRWFYKLIMVCDDIIIFFRERGKMVG